MSIRKKTVYAVYRTAVYRHSCCGIYSDLQRAREAAQFFAKADKDSHHDYEVIPYILNNVPGMTPQRIYSPAIAEESPVYVCSKDSFI